jgi:siroheme decarboxylase
MKENAIQEKEGNYKNSQAELDSRDPNASLIVSLDETDRSILQIIQDDFPLVQHPWLEIGDRLNISEIKVVSRLKRLIETGVIVKIGPVFDSSKMGLKSATLVAMRVPKNKVDDTARIINAYDNVSHNYEREDEYNVWFTLAASNKNELATLLDEVRQKTAVEDQDVLDLPTVRRFKINVHFQLKQT